MKEIILNFKWNLYCSQKICVKVTLVIHSSVYHLSSLNCSCCDMICFILESYSMQKRGGVKLKHDLDILGKTATIAKLIHNDE